MSVNTKIRITSVVSGIAFGAIFFVVFRYLYPEMSMRFSVIACSLGGIFYGAWMYFFFKKHQGQGRK